MGTSRVRKNGTLIEEINRTKPPYGTLAIWNLGQESIVVKGDGIVLYIDPFVSDYVQRILGFSRCYEVPIVPEDITNATMCLITHDHEDHLDPGTLEVLSKSSPGSMVLAPSYCELKLIGLGFRQDRLRNTKTLEWTTWCDGRLKIFAVPAAHEEFEVDTNGSHRYVGYVIRLNGVTLYHAGDTLVYPGLVDSLKAQRIDIACLPINGRDYFRTNRQIAGNMTYREAAELAWEIGVDTVVPFHYDTFDWNTEKPGNFVQYLYEHYPEQKCHLLARGERWLYAANRAFIV